LFKWYEWINKICATKSCLILISLQICCPKIAFHESKIKNCIIECQSYRVQSNFWLILFRKPHKDLSDQLVTNPLKLFFFSQITKIYLFWTIYQRKNSFSGGFETWSKTWFKIGKIGTEHMLQHYIMSWKCIYIHRDVIKFWKCYVNKIQIITK